jgi:tRNA nucleotidyltransferase (CCA-adding enzyme)
MAYDPVSGELLDFFCGTADLEKRVLRATSDAFSEDPLRVLRGMQFAAASISRSTPRPPSVPARSPINTRRCPRNASPKSS